MKLYKETGHIKSRVITKKKYVSRTSAKIRPMRKRSTYDHKNNNHHSRENNENNESMSHLSDNGAETPFRLETQDIPEQEV